MCKGSWHGAAVTEGLCGRDLPDLSKVDANSQLVPDNPSASHTLGTSLYTREAMWTETQPL